MDAAAPRRSEVTPDPRLGMAPRAGTVDPQGATSRWGAGGPKGRPALRPPPSSVRAGGAQGPSARTDRDRFRGPTSISEDDRADLGSAAVLSLSNSVQAYAWGEVDGLARLVGSPPTGGPEAELWVGAHPAAPSRAPGGRTLDQVVAAGPGGLLGAGVADRFGGRLPFLLKVLAIGAPLSIQLHPSGPQAEEGFAREEAAGLGADDPRRSYRDPLAKPEVLVAVSPTWVLAGLRRGDAAARALAQLGASRGDLDELASVVAGEPDARAGLVHLLSAPPPVQDALAGVAAAVDPAVSDVARWVAVLAREHPRDPTALAPALLDLRRLEVGEGIFLPAGVPHVYLRGAGVELMGASDNVVRGGLTTKHVDRDELVRLMAAPGDGVVDLPGETGPDGLTTYAPDVAELALHRRTLGSDPVALGGPPSGPAVAIVVGGSGTVAVADDTAALEGGDAVLVPEAERETCRVAGSGTLWFATVGTRR